jgi:hypothetical protein
LSIANVTTLTTFLEWMGRTNQLIVQGEQLGSISSIVFDKANVAYVSANNSANSANAYAVAVGAASNTWANIAFTNSYPFANDRANSANAYAVTIGAAANNASDTKDTAGNNYTIQVGAASNVWANLVGTAGNNYTIQVGAASNTLATSIGAAGNNYTNAVGAAANNASDTKDTAGNNYTIQVGAASNTLATAIGNAGNNYTNAVGTAGNNYTIQVGAASNTWANSQFYTTANGTAAFAKANNSVQNNTTTQITVGYTVKAFNISSNIAAYSTWKPDPANGNYQFATSNGAFTVDVPASQNCAIDILITNGVNAKTISFSGYTAPGGGGGDTYTTTNANKYILMLRAINNVATYAWKSLN